MDDNWLVLVALCITGTGIAVLTAVLMLLPIPEVDDLNNQADGTTVRIRGNLLSSEDRGSLTVLTISKPDIISAISFEKLPEIPEGCIIISGKKDTYNDEPQIIINKILSCDSSRE
ncbi:hypothetical protein GOV11_02585 [Candidatus Woesearchaeota archaeon]|nr:hypothetical protein [Candidatus Woesearchaeota archaeon]